MIHCDIVKNLLLFLCFFLSFSPNGFTNDLEKIVQKYPQWGYLTELKNVLDQPQFQSLQCTIGEAPQEFPDDWLEIKLTQGSQIILRFHYAPPEQEAFGNIEFLSTLKPHLTFWHPGTIYNLFSHSPEEAAELLAETIEDAIPKNLGKDRLVQMLSVLLSNKGGNLFAELEPPSYGKQGAVFHYTFPVSETKPVAVTFLNENQDKGTEAMSVSLSINSLEEDYETYDLRLGVAKTRVSERSFADPRSFSGSDGLSLVAEMDALIFPLTSPWEIDFRAANTLMRSLNPEILDLLRRLAGEPLFVFPDGTRVLVSDSCDAIVGGASI